MAMANWLNDCIDQAILFALIWRFHSPAYAAAPASIGLEG
jgi:hypothetical protein